MKLLARVSAILLLAGAGFLAYARWGPWFETITLVAPLGLSSDAELDVPFQIQKTYNYQVDLLLPADIDNVRGLLGDYDTGRPGELNLTWAVQKQGVVIASGSLPEAKPRFLERTGPVYYRLASFHAVRGSGYSLQAHSRPPAGTAIAAQGSLRVRADGFNLHEERLSYQILGIGLLFLGTAGMAIILVMFMLNRQNNAAAGSTARGI